MRHVDPVERVAKAIVDGEAGPVGRNAGCDGELVRVPGDAENRFDREVKRISILHPSRVRGESVVVGGGTDDSEGWFVEPTVIKTDDPGFRLLRDELFGPVVTVQRFSDEEEAIALANDTPYGLAGAVMISGSSRKAALTASLRSTPSSGTGPPRVDTKSTV